MLKNNFRIISILCLIASLSRFVLDSYLPSLPAISHYFTISNADAQLTLTVYLLGFSLSQLIYGPLSDRFGRRVIIMSGMSIFLLGNLMCSFAISLNILLMARLIAGVGAGACGVLNRAIASDCFQGVDFAKAWSYTTTALVLTLIAAPVLGGYVQETLGWRANFMLAAGLVAFVLMLALKYLPETHRHQTTEPLNISTIISNYHRVLISRSFLLHTICYTLAFSGLIIYFQISPQLYINIFGLSPIQYGYSSIVIAISYLAGGLIVNHLSARIGTHGLLQMGAYLLLCAGMMLLLLFMYLETNLMAVLTSTAIYVVGARIIIPNAISGSMKEFRHMSGVCSALVGCMQMLGSACISYLLTYFDFSTPFPLALFYLGLGMTSLTIVYFLEPNQRVKLGMKIAAEKIR